MSERKVLNKYYPPDFDVTKLPKLKLQRNRQFVIRIMAPFSMRCKTCGDYIYKGRKFNSRMETIKDDTYLGLRKYRFYIKCPKCLSEITFKTDPEKTDYEMEHGATRNFQAHKFAAEEESRLKAEKEEEEMNNPMKALENRTKESRLEMSRLEDLEDIKEINKRYAIIDHESLLKRHVALEDEILAQQKAEDEEAIRQAFSNKGGEYYKRINDSESDDDNVVSTPKGEEKATSGTHLVEPYVPVKKKGRLSSSSSSGSRDSLASSLANLKQGIRSKDVGGSSSKEKRPLTGALGAISDSKPSSGKDKDTIGLINKEEGKLSTGLGLVGDYNSSEEGSSED